MSMFKPTPDASFLRARYDYSPSTGILTSKYGRWAGKPITQTEAQGYVVLRLNREQFKAHRIIWKMMTGSEAPDELDHWDRNRANNRWKNLRVASKTRNQWNRTVQHQSRSQLIGAFWSERNQRWASEICVNKKKIWLGYFPTAAAAHEAYKKAAARLR